MILWSKKNLTFSYERIVKPNQSFTVSLGFLELPDLLSDSIGHIISITKREKYGFNFNAEYRFYFTNRNRNAIPDGLYWAPYISHYNTHFKNSFDIIGKLDSAGVFKGDIYALNVGLELGYQFVFKNRLTIDLVLLGPSFSYYALNLGVSGQMNFEKIKDINEDFYNKLQERFPNIQNIEYNKSVSEKYRANAFSGGFRYLVQIGYRF